MNVETYCFQNAVCYLVLVQQKFRGVLEEEESFEDSILGTPSQTVSLALNAFARCDAQEGIQQTDHLVELVRALVGEALTRDRPLYTTPGSTMMALYEALPLAVLAASECLALKGSLGRQESEIRAN